MGWLWSRIDLMKQGKLNPKKNKNPKKKKKPPRVK